MNTQEQAYIEGFVKRASEYGFSYNEAINLLKQSAEDGPFSMDQVSKAEADDTRLKGLVHNRHHHPAHYYLNPAVGGPIEEVVTRVRRRIHRGSTGKGGWAKQIPYGIPAIFSDQEHAEDTSKKLHEKHLKKIDTSYHHKKD